MADSKKKRKNKKSLNFEDIKGTSLLACDKTAMFTPSEWNIRMRLFSPSQTKELHRMLFSDVEKVERYLLQGIRLLKMWQKEKEPHRKKYYWHISELKLSRALGNEQALSFQIGGVDYNLHRDQSGKARIGLGKQPLPSPDDFGKAIPFNNK